MTQPAPTARPTSYYLLGAAFLALLAWGFIAWETWRAHLEEDRNRVQAELEQNLDFAATLLVERLNRLEMLLESTAGYWRRPDALTATTAQDWSSYVNGLDLTRLHPEISMMGLVTDTPAAMKAELLTQARRDYPEYTIFPASLQDAYFPIRHAEPKARARGALGFDLGSEPKRRAALIRARENGETTMTEPLRATANVGAQRDFMLFAPLSQPTDAVVHPGWAFIAFRADLLMGPLAQLVKREGVQLTLSQRGPESKTHLFGGHSDEARLTAERSVDVFGQTWALRANGVNEIDVYASASHISGLILHILAASVGALGVGAAMFERAKGQGGAMGGVSHQQADRAIARARMILDASPAVVYARGLRAEDSVTFVSNSVTQFGFNPDDLALRTDWLDVAVHPADRAAVHAFRANLPIAGGGEITYRLHDAAGHWRWVADRARIIYDEKGDPSEMVGAISDVDERVAAEKSEQRLSRMLALLSAVNELVAKEGSEEDLIGDVCRAAVQIGGFRMVWCGDASDASGRWIHILARAGLGVDRLDDFHPSRQDIGAPWTVALNDNQPAASDHAATDPALAPWRDALTELGVSVVAASPIRVYGRHHACIVFYAEDPDAFTDAGAMELLARLVDNLSHGLTARRTAYESRLIAERLSQSEERFRLAFEVSPYIVSVTERDTGRLVVVNEALQTILGYNAAPGDMTPIWADPMDRLKLIGMVSEQDRALDAPFKLRHADGRLRDGLVSAAPLTINGVACLMSIIRDVTDERQLAETAEAERRKYRTIVEAASEGYWLIDATTKTTREVNDALTKMLGYTASEMIGRTPMEFAAPRDRALLEQQTGKIPQTTHRRYEATFLRKDGREVITRLSASTLRDVDGRALAGVAFVSDVTAERIREREIERLRTRLRLVLDAAGEAVVQVDAYGHIALANHAATVMLGASERDLLGLPWGDVMRSLTPDGERLDDALCPVLAACRDGAPHRFDGAAMLRHDGVKLVIDGAASPLPPPGGAVLVLQDAAARIEAQRTHEERQEIYRQMFQKNTAIKLLIDPEDGAIIDANDSAAQYYGYALDQLRTMKISDINTLSSEDVKAEMAQAAQDQRTFFCFKHRRADGHLRDVEVYSGPVRVGGKVLLHSIVTDVTERNSFEEKLKIQARELERSNADLQQFAYVASHDLRQPLRIITSYIGLLNNRLKGKLEEEESQFVSFISDGAKRMDALIVDLLEYSRVGKGAEAPVLVDLTDAAREAAANLGLDLPTAEATFQLDAPLPAILGHRGELVRLFQNLVGNAIKYRHPDRAPVIRIFAQEGDEEWVVGVKDNGLGVREEHFDRIFQIFQRLHGRDKYEGTGVGLAICRKIMQRHSGRIWIESVPDEGSTFFTAFPRLEESGDGCSPCP